MRNVIGCCFITSFTSIIYFFLSSLFFLSIFLRFSLFLLSYFLAFFFLSSLFLPCILFPYFYFASFFSLSTLCLPYILLSFYFLSFFLSIALFILSLFNYQDKVIQCKIRYTCLQWRRWGLNERFLRQFLLYLDRSENMARLVKPREQIFSWGTNLTPNS